MLGAMALAILVACGADAGGGFGHGYGTHHVAYSQPTYYNQALILPVAVTPPYNPFYYTVQDYYGQSLLADAIAARSAALTQKSPTAATTPCEHLKSQLEQLAKRMESLEKPAVSAPEKLTAAPSSGADAIKQSCAQCHSGKVAKGGFAIEQLTTPAAIGSAMQAILEGRMPKKCPTCVPLSPKTTGEALLFLSAQLSKVK
ncbi:MAG: hypothetical protein K1X74_23245 [Pirellulales bacterium]|nr:hypothetical protein [Pirellulales bacterium]